MLLQGRANLAKTPASFVQQFNSEAGLMNALELRHISCFFGGTQGLKKRALSAILLVGGSGAKADGGRWELGGHMHMDPPR